MILPDPHILLWMDRDDSALGPRSRQLILDGWQRGAVAVSAISFWEAAILAQRGRIALPTPVETGRAELLEAGVREIPLDGRILLKAAQLEGLHRDPADRFIVATAFHGQGTLLTADAKILAWSSTLPRHDGRT